MLYKIVFFVLLLNAILQAEFQYTVENTNFTLYQGSTFTHSSEKYLYNYDRLRVNIDYTKNTFFAKIIGDGMNYLAKDYVNSPDFNYVTLIRSDTPYATQTKLHNYDAGSIYAKLYRLYGGYEDDKNRVTLGLQNITMGVGRLWTPTNLFNPKNIYALEPDEVFGVSALSYTRHISDNSDITVTTSLRKDNTLKYAARYNSFLEYGDFALDALYSDTSKMLGYEFEGNLGDTGVEVRTEGAYINSQEVEFFQGIIGADYAFVNGINLVIEALYSSKTFSFVEIYSNINSDILSNLTYSHFYTGTTLSYSFNIFLNTSLLYIESFNTENSRFISPTLTYTLNDFNTFIFGTLLQYGNENSEFGAFKNNTYYFNYKFSF